MTYVKKDLHYCCFTCHIHSRIMYLFVIIHFVIALIQYKLIILNLCDLNTIFIYINKNVVIKFSAHEAFLE